MHYENFLFTRNQRQDFTAFVRPSALSNKDVSAIGAIFNYITDISRLTTEFPSLYTFPLGEYVFLLRHYNSGRKHAGRAIGIIEGITVKQSDANAFSDALPQFIAQQADLLNVSASITDIEEASSETSANHEWNGSSSHAESEPFIAEFAERRQTDRLFLPFTPAGRNTLMNVVADRRLSPTPYFAFGTNSDVLAQLEHQAQIDIASFFKTDRPSFRSRRTNRVTSYIGAEAESEAAPDPSMSLRPVVPNATSLRRETEPDEENDSDTRVGSYAMSVRQSRRDRRSESTESHSMQVEDLEDEEPTLLTMRQMRDKARAEEAAAHPPEAEKPHSSNPIRRLIEFVASLVSPPKSE
jgi:hypothetical protein